MRQVDGSAGIYFPLSSETAAISYIWRSSYCILKGDDIFPLETPHRRDEEKLSLPDPGLSTSAHGTVGLKRY
jgi:hypothetical protein